MPEIVVGVDGSQAGKDALRWAVRQAGLSGARLRVVYAWNFPTNYGNPVDYSGIDFEKAAHDELQQTLQDVVGPKPQIPLATEVIEGHAAPVLIKVSRGAELLVVGSHGHGAFIGMLLGSVSQHCAQHAPCPVVVVRHDESTSPDLAPAP